MSGDLIGCYDVKWHTDKVGTLFDTLQLALQHIETNWPHGDPNASVMIIYMVY
jgi:hypothetical protein